MKDYTVKTLYKISENTYLERIVYFKAKSFNQALKKGEKEALDYSLLKGYIYLDLSDAFLIDKNTTSMEFYSIMPILEKGKFSDNTILDTHFYTNNLNGSKKGLYISKAYYRVHYNLVDLQYVRYEERFNFIQAKTTKEADSKANAETLKYAKQFTSGLGKGVIICALPIWLDLYKTSVEDFKSMKSDMELFNRKFKVDGLTDKNILYIHFGDDKIDHLDVKKVTCKR